MIFFRNETKLEGVTENMVGCGEGEWMMFQK